MQTRKTYGILIVAAAAALTGVACLGGGRCDPGMVLVKETCVVVTDAGASAAPLSATVPTGESAGIGDGGAAACMPGQGFGSKCKVTSECPCGLDYCNTFANMNECTRTGCKDDPKRCPTGWTCFDPSAFDKTLPSICIKS